jgi:ABC-type multidrug transport system permease subunit
MTRTDQEAPRRVLIGIERRSRPSAAQKVGALVARDLATGGLLRLPILLDVAFGVVNLVVFLFISRVLTIPAVGAVTQSATYFDFVAVGITFMLVVQAASTQLISRILGELRGGTLEMLVTQPTPVWTLAIGLSAYPFLLALLRAGIYLAVLSGLLGMHVAAANWLGVLVVLATGSAAMMAFGIGLMAFSIAVGHGDAAARLLVVGLSFASGTYFPVTMLPTFLRQVSAVLPTRIALDGLRHAMAGAGWVHAASVLLAITAVGLPVSIWLFGLSLRLAAYRGTLTRG